jgi:hypothetical protein
MPCRIIAVPATSSTTPTSAKQLSLPQPIRKPGPYDRTRHGRNRANAEQRPIDTSRQVAEHAGEAKAKTDGGVGAHSSKWLGADEAEQRRKPQCAEDESDKPAEHPDQRSRQDRCPCAETSRVRPPRVRLRTNEVGPEREQRHADDN